MSILEIKNLRKKFDGVQAVNNLSIKLEPGKITGIIGPNGSGKSTLINLLTGMFPFDEGMIVIAETTKLSKIKSHEVADYGITRTFQDVRLFEQMPVIDNILIALTERNIWSSLFEKHKPFHLKQAEEVLRQVNLWEKRNELAVNLSYGQRKLLEIARVLAMTASGGKEASIFFFDEPFAGLFPEMAKVVTAVLKHLREQGKTIVLVEHNMDLIRELSDHVIVLDSGQLLAEGEPEATLAKEEVIEAYLGE
jgi:ABC-type branched-subunit amino acid transport system ATPase component